MGHPQPATKIKTDNATANGIINGNVKQNRSKGIDMRFYWLQDRVQQQQFDVYWAPGAINLADYFTKLHSPTHHIALRPIYLHDPHLRLSMQGCIEILQMRAKPKVSTRWNPTVDAPTVKQTLTNARSNPTVETPLKYCKCARNQK